jgi:hypothetical protein
MNCENKSKKECIGDGIGDIRYDAYGIPTGYYCDKCYHDGNYPYRKDKYEYWEHGERLDWEE